MWKKRKITILLMTCLWGSVLFCPDFWEARITAGNATMFMAATKAQCIWNSFYMRCWIRTLAHDICFDPDSGSSLFLKVKTLFFFFFCFDAPSSSCTFFVKIYQYNRIIINSSFNSSFRIPKWWGLQNAKKNHIDFFKQTNCNNPWIITTTERKLNLR